MSFSMQKLKSILPGTPQTVKKTTSTTSTTVKRQTEILEPEIGFQISIELHEQSSSGAEFNGNKALMPELNVHLIAARHLPSLFGFKIVQGYLIKVKLFPGTKRLDSTIQTNTWPKFNEHFRFPLAPDIKPSLKHSSRRGSKSAVSDFTPEELFAGQFVVFTVYALLELPPTTFNRFSKTYRSLKDKSSNLMQNIFETTTNDKENREGTSDEKSREPDSKNKRKSMDLNPKDPMPPLTISEARRNLGSVTCYLEPKIFQRNSRGIYITEELWLPIKDLTTTVNKGSNKNNNNNSNNLSNAAKGVVELALQLKDLSEPIDPTWCNDSSATSTSSTTESSIAVNTKALQNGSTSASVSVSVSSQQKETHNVRNAQSWNRMTSQVKRRMGISNVNTKLTHCLALKVTTTRMRCSHKAKDELEHTAGSVYVKTTVFEHGIYLDSWKSSNFYPSLSTKWDVPANTDAATLTIPLQSIHSLDHILIRTTLATKTKIGKKLVLGTVVLGKHTAGNGAEHIRTLRETPLNERVAMWHCYQ
ncbi:uncharacterized protein LOC119632605 [Glossina fuscipes]|uniref:Uncharacterized protein LOC119632605 n=2 Tax=Nemorhina TaxID=44051 RepID=A0A8U0W8F1_9MUSC|nr:uncharacterized protein LOC119632605 [Glossina fuscipes]XP_037881513.1 uncharacterized protein LOC119632605 [Glossina fuscipes]XP_037881514.1 uncharacterized protein LOC119632605 [Glossina fuscipes]KAI9587165.1 hypothetical protein GQX74_003012 [Glossina fuscipes]